MFINMLGTWIRGLASIALIVAGVLLVKEWFDELPTEAPGVDQAIGAQVFRPLTTLGQRLEAWDPEPNRSTGLLVFGLVALLLSVGGRLVSPLMWRKSGSEPRTKLRPRIQRIATGNGYEIELERHGTADAPPLVLVHGVGSDRTQWREVIEDLSDHFRIYAYDLLGHGKSDHVSRAEHSIAAAARDLDEVISLSGREKVVLVGHSMGGMIAMEWCATHLDAAQRLAGLVLVHTTPRNPFETMAPVSFHRAVQKFLHEPILRMTIPMAPLVRVMNGLNYLNGTTHWANDQEMFGGKQSREQLEGTARLHARMDPAAVARFTLAMTRFEARHRLPTISVPTLVVAAEGDRTTTPSASHMIADRIPDARLVTLNGARHMGFMEHRSVFAELIRGFRSRTGKTVAERPEGKRRANRERKARRQAAG